MFGSARLGSFAPAGAIALLPALVAWVLSVAFAPAAFADAAAPSRVEAPAPDYLSWPQDGSDIRPDPRIRFGVLRNGMRYAIRRNTQPAGTVAIRLRIAAGSLQETGAQQGLAHFLEHLAFQGSKNIAQGDMVKILQRLGLRFGPDTNASTAAAATTYQLNLPKSDAETVDTALMLLREIADRLTLSSNAMTTERGVILSEEKTGDTPGYRSYKSKYALIYEGLRLPSRWPIGKTSVIRSAPIGAVRNYYEKFYRPERGLLVVTGDIDPDALEAKIKTLFADWSRPGPAAADPGRGEPKPHPLRAASFIDSTLPEGVSLSWLQPEDRSLPDKAASKRWYIQQLAVQIVNRRLDRIALAPDPPFLAAAASRAIERNVATTSSLDISSRPGAWRKAMQAADAELRRALVYGVQTAELNLELKNVTAGLEAAVRGADTQDTVAIAESILSTFASRTVFAHPKEVLALWHESMRDVTAVDVDSALKEMFGGAPSLIFLTGASPVAGGDRGVRAAFEDGRQWAVAPPAPMAEKVFPYTDFGRPGTIAARGDLADLGVTEVTFANGVRLNIKPTAFAGDQVQLYVRFDGGYLEFSKDTPFYDALWSTGLLQSGLNKLDAESLDEALAGRTVAWNFYVSDDAYWLAGGTAPQDLLVELQVLAAFATDAAYRPEALASVQAGYEGILKGRFSDASHALGWDLQAILRSGDARWASPSLDQVRATTIDDIKGKLAPAFARAPVEITIVGDTSVEAAIDAVAGTFGALPRRSKTYTAPPGARDLRFPKQRQKIVLTHQGRADQAIAYVAWPTADFYANPRRTHAVRLLADMIQLALTDSLRSQGKTYSPSVYFDPSTVFAGFGYLQVSVETSPEYVASIYEGVDALTARIRAGGIPDDLLARARRPAIESRENAMKTNSFWIVQLSDIQSEPRAAGAIRGMISDYQTISKDEIVAAARDVLDDRRRIEIRVLPSGAQAAAAN